MSLPSMPTRTCPTFTTGTSTDHRPGFVLGTCLTFNLGRRLTVAV